MNKSQLKQFSMIQAYVANGMNDVAARGLSAMIRAALSNKSKQAMIQAANDLGLIGNREFII